MDGMCEHIHQLGYLVNPFCRYLFGYIFIFITSKKPTWIYCNYVEQTFFTVSRIEFIIWHVEQVNKANQLEPTVKI